MALAHAHPMTSLKPLLPKNNDMSVYRLSEAADADFERLFEYGIETFGINQALNYVKGMQKHFEKIAENPQHYQSVDYIRSGYRRSVYGKHSIDYLSETGKITIVRILNMENPDKALS